MMDYPKIGELTEKERIFCIQYCTVWNATKAAIEAGYSGKTARQIGYENLTKLHIQEYIQFIKDNAADFAGVSILRNIQELAKVAYGSAADLRKAWETLEDWETLPEDVKASIAEVTVTTRTINTLDENQELTTAELETVKVKQYDKLKALEMLNRMLGFNAAEKKDITSGGKSLVSDIDYDKLSDAALIEIAKAKKVKVDAE